MKTLLNTIHEEEYSDKSRVIGVLLNFSIKNGDFKDSFIYIYRKGIYIFFNTIIDCMDYLLYSDSNVQRAYMRENDFDELYDKPKGIDGEFRGYLKWLTGEKI